MLNSKRLIIGINTICICHRHILVNKHTFTTTRVISGLQVPKVKSLYTVDAIEFKLKLLHFPLQCTAMLGGWLIGIGCL